VGRGTLGGVSAACASGAGAAFASRTGSGSSGGVIVKGAPTVTAGWPLSSTGLISATAAGGFVAWAGGKWLVAMRAATFAGRVRMGLLVITAPLLVGDEAAVETGASLEGLAIAAVAAALFTPPPLIPSLVLPNSIARGASGSFTLREGSAFGCAAASSPPPAVELGGAATSGAVGGGELFAIAEPSAPWDASATGSEGEGEGVGELAAGAGSASGASATLAVVCSDGGTDGVGSAGASERA
jgi:hypothetical protein